jgi:S-DNA-T family DNA segregation ATPase FtsK/SpoIIIE
MVGAPVLAHPPRTAGEPEIPGTRLEGDELASVVRRVAGAQRAPTVARLPKKVLLDDVFAGITEPLLPEVVPFGLAESNLPESPLITACIDFADHPHVVATGLSGAGLSTWARAMMRGIMRSYTPEEATIILIEHRRANIGVVPQENWLGAYAQNPSQIEAVVKDLCAILERRRPPATATAEELATKRFWEGREFFVVIDGITSWSNTANPLVALAPYVGDAEDLGLHIVVTADIRQFSYQSQGQGVLGRTMAMQPPVLVMNGHRSHGAVVPGVFAEPQREGKGRLVTRRGVEGVLVGWSEPPVLARRR